MGSFIPGASISARRTRQASYKLYILHCQINGYYLWCYTYWGGKYNVYIFQTTDINDFDFANVSPTVVDIELETTDPAIVFSLCASQSCTGTNTHTNTHTHIYIYICLFT